MSSLHKPVLIIYGLSVVEKKNSSRTRGSRIS